MTIPIIPELLSCPFCKKWAGIIHYQNNPDKNGDSEYYYLSHLCVFPTSSPIKIFIRAKTKAGVEIKWNTRHPQPDFISLIRKMEEALKWYATPENYEMPIKDNLIIDSAPIEMDWGYRADRILAEAAEFLKETK